MKDELLIITKIKKTILRLNKIISNFPRNEIVLRDGVKSEMYSLLKNAYLANNSIDDRKMYQSLMLVNIKMVDFYMNESYKSKYISEKQYISISTHLIEIFKMIKGWVNIEKSKQSL